MKLGYTIVYVPDVAATLSFFEAAFDLKRRFLHDSGDYGELDTGATTLAFASHALGAANFSEGYVRASESAHPLGMEIALVTDAVDAAYSAGISAGAKPITPPAIKPWGQTVAYLRCPAGILIELCTPMQ